MNNGIMPPSKTWAHPSLAIDAALLETLCDHLIAVPCRYHLGAKAPSLTADASTIHHIDCSGLSKYAVAKCTGQKCIMPDGSVQQHAWVKINGFKTSLVTDGDIKDGAVRIAFLPPTSPLGPGDRHVMLIHNGHTIESHGSTVGVSRRAWGSQSWMKYCSVYVLTPPTGE